MPYILDKLKSICSLPVFKYIFDFQIYIAPYIFGGL